MPPMVRCWCSGDSTAAGVGATGHQDAPNRHGVWKW
jgi:hypothetical protein